MCGGEVIQLIVQRLSTIGNEYLYPCQSMSSRLWPEMTCQVSEFRQPCLKQHLPFSFPADHKAWKSSATNNLPKPSPGSASPKHPHTLSRKQWRNRQKNKRRHKNKFRPPPASDELPAKDSTEETEVPPALRPDSQETRAGALRARMAQRLDGARFRYLNEQLYSGPSSAAQRLFQEDPEAFLLYHRGFQSQVKKWPLQPVDRIARDLRQR